MFWTKSLRGIRMCCAQQTVITQWNMLSNKIKVQIALCVCVCLYVNLHKMNKVRGLAKGKRKKVGLGGGRPMLPPVARAGSRCPGLGWCCSRRRRWRGALCAPCYLLEALLVPSLAVDTVGGDLPPIRDILADLGPVAIPLAPLAIGLGCSEAHLVLLQD